MDQHGGHFGAGGVNGLSVADDQALDALLRELDAAAAGEAAQYTNKRAHPRKHIPLRCLVQHVEGTDGVLRDTFAKTRDLSIGGIGFISRRQYPRQTELLISIAMPNQSSRRVTAQVVYSRPLRDGWFLTGARFGPIDDDRLARAKLEAKGAPKPKPRGGQSRRAAGSATDSRSARDMAMALINEVSSGWRITSEKAEKIIAYSGDVDHVVRRATIPVLLHIGGTKAINALLQLLKDTNTDIQAEAAEMLGRMGAHETKDELGELLKSKSELVAVSAADALGRLGDQRGLRVVAECLQTDSEMAPRAARALGVIVGRKFRPNSEGVEAARAYIKRHKL